MFEVDEVVELSTPDAEQACTTAEEAAQAPLNPLWSWQPIDWSAWVPELAGPRADARRRDEEEEEEEDELEEWDDDEEDLDEEDDEYYEDDLDEDEEDEEFEDVEEEEDE